MSLVAVEEVLFTDSIPPDGSVWARGLEALGIDCEGREPVVLAVPSLWEQAHQPNRRNPLDVHAPLAFTETWEIFDALGDHGNAFRASPVRLGGASLVAAMVLAGQLVQDNGDQVLIIGAEALSRMSSRELVRAAGESICPSELVGTTLNPEVPITLITAYALLESGFLGKHALDKVRPRNGVCMSGHIHTDEIAGADDGAVALWIREARQGTKEVFLASGATLPFLERSMSWLTIPRGYNLARGTLGLLPVPEGLRLSDVHFENYDCFLIAKLLQAAGILNLPLNEENLPQILEFCSRWENGSSLREWASWGISSAKKIEITIQALRDGRLQTAGIIGNGGVCDSVAAALLTTDKRIARGLDESANLSGPFIRNRLPEDWDFLMLEHEPEELDGQKGAIDMMTFQQPVRNKDGVVVQPGSTFVRVTFRQGGYSCTLTNLALENQPNSIFDDLTDQVNVGDSVTLRNCDGIIRACVN